MLAAARSLLSAETMMNVPLSLVLPMYTVSHLVLRKEKSSTEVTPMDSESMSCVENQGPIVSVSKRQSTFVAICCQRDQLGCLHVGGAPGGSIASYRSAIAFLVQLTSQWTAMTIWRGQSRVSDFRRMFGSSSCPG